MNIEGRAIQTSRCHNPLGEAKEEWKIFRVLSDLLECDIQFNNLNDVRKKLINENKNFLALLEINNSSNLSFSSKQEIKNQNLSYNISNFCFLFSLRFFIICCSILYYVINIKTT